jgi:hypothetical protein
MGLLLTMVSCKNVDVDNQLDHVGGNETEYLSSDDEKLLTAIYYENDDTAFFSGFNIGDVMEENYDYYNIYWMLCLNDLLRCDIESEIRDNLSNSIITGTIADEETYKFDGVFDVYLRSGIESYCELQLNTPTYVNQLEKNFNSDSQLYALTDQPSIEDLLQTTDVTLKAYCNMKYVPDNIRIIQQKLIDIYMSDGNSLFNIDTIDLKKDLISCGAILIDCLRLCDEILEEDNSNQVMNLEEWIKKVIQEYNRYIELNKTCDAMALQGGVLLNDIIKYMNIEETLEPLPSIDENSFFSADCQMLYQYIFIKKDAGSEQLVKYIKQNYRYHMYSTTPLYDVSDTYYGMLLYEMTNRTFSSEKILQSLYSYLDNEDDMDCQTLYYAVKILEKLNSNSDDIQSIVQNYWDQSWGTSASMKENYYNLYIATNYGTDRYDGIDKQIIKDAKELIDKSDRLINTYYAFLCLNLLNESVDKQALLENLSNFERSDGYTTNIDSDIVSMHSLYRAYVMISTICKNQDIDSNQFHDWAEKLRAPQGGFFIYLDESKDVANYDINFSIEALYYGLFLTEQ